MTKTIISIIGTVSLLSVSHSAMAQLWTEEMQQRSLQHQTDMNRLEEINTRLHNIEEKQRRYERENIRW